MAADANLIKGAAAIGRSMRPADLSGLDKATQAGTQMALAGLEEKRKVEQGKVDAYDNFTKAAETVELNSGALGSVLYNDTVDFANKQKQAYLAALKNGDQKGMMAAKKAMMDRSTFTQQHKSFIQELAQLKGDGKLSSTHDDNPEELKFMTAVLNGEYQVEQNDKGEIVFNVNGVKKTNAEFEDMYILKHVDTQLTLSKLNQQHKNSPLFDRNGIRGSIMQSLPETKKEFRAALSDDVSFDTNFIKLLREDQSINEEMLQGFGIADADPTTVSQKERDALIDVITNVENPNFDLQTSRNIMAEKLTNAVERNHGKFWTNIQREKQKQRNENSTDLNAYLDGSSYVKVSQAKNIANQMAKKGNVAYSNSKTFKYDTLDNNMVQMYRYDNNEGVEKFVKYNPLGGTNAISLNEALSFRGIGQDFTGLYFEPAKFDTKGQFDKLKKLDDGISETDGTTRRGGF